MTISNQERGEANHLAIVGYFDRIEKVPRRPDGTANVARIVRDIPLASRGVIYQNKRNRDAFNEGLVRHGMPPLGERSDEDASTFQRPGALPPDDEKKQLRQRIGQLERELMARGGEVAELRRQLRRYTAIDNHMADTGRLPR